MFVVRAIGWALLLLALATLGRDVWIWATAVETTVVSPGVFSITSGEVPITFGELWYMLSPESPNFVQAIVQRYLHPAVWDQGLLYVVLAPASVVFAVPGLLILLLFRRRRRRRLLH